MKFYSNTFSSCTLWELTYELKYCPFRRSIQPVFFKGWYWCTDFSLILRNHLTFPSCSGGYINKIKITNLGAAKVMVAVEEVGWKTTTSCIVQYWVEGGEVVTRSVQGIPSSFYDKTCRNNYFRLRMAVSEVVTL